MMESVIETRGLTKRYGTIVAVDAVDLRVRRGEIYGFLGRNGAGKTTTLRALLGLIRPDAGEVRLFGERIEPGKGPWRRVGHLVEVPSAYPELTVRENLEIARRLQGVTDRAATQQAIDRLGLGDLADRRAGTLSLGNLQRVGLARALLHRPELLLLDEPANGLDPAGVVEIRELLQTLARREKVTVLMSSHILAEVDRLATRIGILHRGRLMLELDAAELERRRARRLVVDAHDRAAAKAALEAAGHVVIVDLRSGMLLLADARAVDAPEDVARHLAAAGVPPTHLAVEQEDLESHFLKLTGDEG